MLIRLMGAILSMKRLITVIAMAALMAGMNAFAAKSGFMEGFTNSASIGVNGWTSAAGQNGTPWYWLAGTAYHEGSGIGSGGAAYLFATNRLNACSNFIGNYVSSDVRVLSFWLRSENLLPSSLTVILLGGANSFRYAIDFQNSSYTTGRWYQVILPLETMAEAGWTSSITPELADESWFTQVKTNVFRLEFDVIPTLSTSDIKLDNIALDRVTRAAAVAAASNGTLVTWRWVRTNYAYKVQSATNIVSPAWTNYMTWTPTNRDLPVLITNKPDPNVFFRLSE